MGRWSREELEEAFDLYQKTALEAVMESNDEIERLEKKAEQLNNQMAENADDADGGIHQETTATFGSTLETPLQQGVDRRIGIVEIGEQITHSPFRRCGHDEVVPLGDGAHDEPVQLVVERKHAAVERLKRIRIVFLDLLRQRSWSQQCQDQDQACEIHA